MSDHVHTNCGPGCLGDVFLIVDQDGTMREVSPEAFAAASSRAARRQEARAARRQARR